MKLVKDCVYVWIKVERAEKYFYSVSNNFFLLHMMHRKSFL